MKSACSAACSTATAQRLNGTGSRGLLAGWGRLRLSRPGRPVGSSIVFPPSVPAGRRGTGPVRAGRATAITGAQRLRLLLAEDGGVALTACGGRIGYRWMAAARPAARIRTVPAGVPVTGNFAALLCFYGNVD